MDGYRVLPMIITQNKGGQFASKKYPCVPEASFLPIFFILGDFVFLYVSYLCFTQGDIVESVFSFALYVFVLVFAAWCWKRTMWKVEIQMHRIICKA